MPSNGLRELAARKVRLRTCALTTTLFSRFLLGDLFIHGIGGAKYDELGDEIARRFFGIEPPGFLTVSMTLWLGLPSEPATRQDLSGIERALRDLQFNPDRHLSEPLDDEIRKIIETKRAAIARAANDHARTEIEAARRYGAVMRRCSLGCATPRDELSRFDRRRGGGCGRTGSLGTASFRSSFIPRRDSGRACWDVSWAVAAGALAGAAEPP